MKKILITTTILLLLANLSSFAYYDEYTPTKRAVLQKEDQKALKLYKKSGNNVLISNTNTDTNQDLKESFIIQRLKALPYQEPYEIIDGKNSTNQPVIIEFKYLDDLNPDYRDKEVLGYRKEGRLYFYINQRYKSQPSVLLASIVAGKILNLDDSEQSINKVCYNLLSEAYVWHYYTHDKKLKNTKDRFIEEEITLNSIVKADKFTGKYLIKFVNENEYFKGLPQESKGFSNEEFNQKFNNLLKLYREIDS